MTKTETIKILSFPDGSQTVVRGNNVAGVSIEVDDQPSPIEAIIEITTQQADNLQLLASTNEIDFDTMKENIPIMNKTDDQTPKVGTDE